jgi:hypothetical protein
VRIFKDKMVLDPFTAIGLAGSIVQFVDFTYKLVNGTIEIYSSMEGVSKNHLRIEVIYLNLSELCQNLSVADDSDKSIGPVKSLATACRRDADDLLEVVRNIRLREGKNTRWACFRHTLKSVWKEDQIRDLENRLEGYRSQLSFQLLSLFG